MASAIVRAAQAYEAVRRIAARKYVATPEAGLAAPQRPAAIPGFYWKRWEVGAYDLLLGAHHEYGVDLAL